jgi:hypothetical protein
MEFFDKHVLLNLEAYEVSEAGLSSVAMSLPETSPEFKAATDRAMVAAMNVATPAHQLADHIFHQHHMATPGVVYGTNNVQEYRDYLETKKCVYVGPGTPVRDLSLLGCVADAYKHSDLRDKNRPVTSANATVVIATGYGQLPYGEGKYGGVAQVIVRLNDGKERALSKILQNVIEMWRSEIQIHGL